MKIYIQIFCALFSVALAAKVDYSGYAIICVINFKNRVVSHVLT